MAVCRPLSALNSADVAPSVLDKVHEVLDGRGVGGSDDGLDPHCVAHVDEFERAPAAE